MKYTLKVILGCFLIFSSAFASDLVSRCHYTVNAKKNGALLSYGDGLIRLGHSDLIRMGSKNSQIQALELRFSEVQVSPDSSAYDLAGSVFSSSSQSFFNPSGTTQLGGTFGNETAFGILHCELPKDLPYFFVVKGQELLILDRYYPSKVLYAALKNAATCVAGDVKQAAKALEREWTLPIQDLRATSAGLQWNEVITRCLKSAPNSDHPGEDCIESEVTHNGPKSLRSCK